MPSSGEGNDESLVFAQSFVELIELNGRVMVEAVRPSAPKRGCVDIDSFAPKCGGLTEDFFFHPLLLNRITDWVGFDGAQGKDILLGNAECLCIQGNHRF